MQTTAGYTSTADELVNRISALIPSHPEILKIENPFDLFKVEGFKCDDLQPSLDQASWALSKAIAATNTASSGRVNRLAK